MVKMTAGFALASALCLASAAAHKEEYKVRVRNLTYMQPFSPPLIVAHTKDIAMFKEGSVASDEIMRMAEYGDISALLELGSADDIAPYVCGAVFADADVLPGHTWWGTMTVDMKKCGDNPVFSAVAMLTNTNDAFMGINSEGLVTSGSSKSFPPAFDAGTEKNNEKCTHIPGPSCASKEGNKKSGHGEGFIHIHRGVHGVNDLSESVYDWRNPVAEIFVYAP